MSVISELIRSEADGTLSFGNYELESKSKKQDFEHQGDLYKVKTFKEITKLERNGRGSCRSPFLQKPSLRVCRVLLSVFPLASILF